MRYWHIGLCAVVLSLSLGCPGQGDLSRWGWAFATSSNFQDSGTGGACGVRPGSSDGYDSSDFRITPGPKAYLGTYHEDGVDGWDGPTGFYCMDFREPPPPVQGFSKTWTIYVWADPTLGPTANKISFSWTVAAIYGVPSEVDVWLTFTRKPEGVAGGPAVGTAWHLSQVPNGGVELPVFRASDGRTGYVFDFTATVIPEPSSLAALGLALAGVGIGVARRRR